MQCKTCGYRLWQLKSRVCPECGSPFRPSDFEFRFSSVKYLCPHCSQEYYGTDEHGHLVPAEFDCVRCGRHIHMDEMVLLPADGVLEERTAADVNPWLDTSRKSWVMRWLATVGQSAVLPAKLMRATPDGSSVSRAFAFAFLTLMVSTSVSLILGVLFMAFALASAGGADVVSMLAVFVGMAFAWVVGLMVMALIWGVITHGILCLGARPAAGIGRTLQAVLYACAPSLLALLPCIGGYMLPFVVIWWAICATIMVKEAHPDLSPGKSVFAALTPPVSFALLLITLVTVLVVATMSATPTAYGPPVVQSPRVLSGDPGELARGRTLAAGMRRYAVRTSNRQVGHIAALVASGDLQVNDLVASWTLTTTQDVAIGSVTIDQFAGLDPERQAFELEKARRDLPDDVVAYRLGDCVFVHPGVDLLSDNPEIWVIVLCPDPDANGDAADAVVVATRDCDTYSISAAMLPAELAEQNRLREMHGLPRLPDPTTVRHDHPVTPE